MQRIVFRKNMSPKNKVLELSYLCLKIVSTQLIHALSDDESNNNEVVQSYLNSATYEVLQDLLKNILNSVNLDAAIRLSCLQLLLREDVQKLDTGIFPNSYYEKILDIIRTQGIRLQQLNLKGVWVRDYPKLLSDLICSLKYLKVLIIPHMADDSVIEAILTCSLLNVLDICGETCYTLNGIRKLKSDNIRVLDIGNFGKKYVCDGQLHDFELIAELIEKLPNLASLRTYSFSGSPLLMLYNKNRQFKTKLIYIHDTGTSSDSIEAIINVCPSLESIHIDNPEENVIAQLSNLKKLNSLKLTKGNSNELINYLQAFGSKLQILKLNHNKNTALDISEICLFVPNLVTLELFQMKLTYTQLDTYFMSLQNIELLYCDMSDGVLKYLLTNTPFLKRIVVGCVIHMTDGDLFRLCAECDFACLEEVWFSCARGLTATSVELLMGHCANLKVIGQLSGWDMHQDELDYLRTVISSSNTDLTLLPVGNLFN